MGKKSAKDVVVGVLRTEPKGTMKTEDLLDTVSESNFPATVITAAIAELAAESRVINVNGCVTLCQE